MSESNDLKGIFALPNEILLNVFSLFPTQDLLSLTTTCRHLHSLILRLLHHRLQVAAGLAGNTLYLECHHPSAKWTAARMFCPPLGTDGLDVLQTDIYNNEKYLGLVERLGGLYTRFKPQQHEPEFKLSWRRPGDIPGSRTHPDSNPQAETIDENEIVRDIVTVDAHDLFSQLETQAYLGKRQEGPRGFLVSTQPVVDGTIRVWRDWLKKHCESRSFTDESTVVVYHCDPSDAAASSSKSGPGDTACDPKRHPNVLWVNTRHDDVGLKFGVKRKKQQVTMNAMNLYASDVDMPVSYVVEFEEVYVRTAHLLFMLEESAKQRSNESGKAIVFGAWSGPD